MAPEFPASNCFLSSASSSAFILSTICFRAEFLQEPQSLQTLERIADFGVGRFGDFNRSSAGERDGISSGSSERERRSEVPVVELAQELLDFFREAVPTQLTCRVPFDLWTRVRERELFDCVRGPGS